MSASVSCCLSYLSLSLSCPLVPCRIMEGTVLETDDGPFFPNHYVFDIPQSDEFCASASSTQPPIQRVLGFFNDVKAAEA